MDFSPAEWMACAMARELADGDTVAVGLATTLPFCGIMLARRTHAPNLKIGYVVGHGTMNEPRPASLHWNEKLTMDRIERTWGFAESALDWLPRAQPKEFFRPAQIDRQGRTNNLKVAKTRFPGAAGIPDVTRYHKHVYFYVPNHSPWVFVPEVEFESGIAYSPVRVITNLAILDFDRHWRITYLRPGVNVSKVRAEMHFAVDPTDDLFEPDPRYIELLRTEIDPLDTRDLELYTGDERLARLGKILDAERRNGPPGL